MRIFRGLDRVNPERFHSPVVTIGVFDGVHRGHQKVLDAMREWAREVEGEPIVITFDQHPRQIVSGDPPPMITSFEHRMVLFERLGMSACVILLFDQKIAGMSAEEFLKTVVIGRIDSRRIVLGPDSHFGRGREGNIAFLERVRDRYNLEVRSVEQASNDGQAISSTAIRNAISSGELDRAERMLGRRPSVLGSVVEGDRRGRDLGFPTANLSLHHELCPPGGVYGARIRLGNQDYHALVNIGSRPTFYRNEQEPLVEVHILDFEGNIYGHVLEVFFLVKLRDEERFESIDALIAQMHRDREDFLAQLSGLET